jgi:alpha-ribazole phosphatase
MTDERLLEYNFGDWEMKRWGDIDEVELDPWMQDL